MKIAVIGAGLAGIEAALAARKAGASNVTIFSRENVLPYMRPRLPEIAFSTGDVASIAMHPKEWYEEKGISLRLDTLVSDIDRADREQNHERERDHILETPDGDELFDAVILSMGGNAFKPVVRGAAAAPTIYTLWSADDARRVNRQVKRSHAVAILGGGILGVECSLRAAKAGLQVHLIERNERLMASQFDADASAAIRAKLAASKVVIHTGTTLDYAEQIGSKLCMRLSTEKKSVDVDFLLMTVGARSNFALAQTAGITIDRGICVDEMLQTSSSLIFAAGDCAQYGGVGRFSARGAIIQGRVAGFNAVAAVAKGAGFARCPIDEIPLLFKSRDLEMHAWGQTAENTIGGKVIRLDNGKKKNIVKAEVKRSDGMVVGVQMVGTGDGFDERVKELVAKR